MNQQIPIIVIDAEEYSQIIGEILQIKLSERSLNEKKMLRSYNIKTSKFYVVYNDRDISMIVNTYIKDKKVVIDQIYDYDVKNTEKNIGRVVEILKSDFTGDIEFIYFHYTRENFFSMNYYFYYSMLDDKIPSKFEEEEKHELLSEIFDKNGFSVYSDGDKDCVMYTHIFSPMKL